MGGLCIDRLWIRERGEVKPPMHIVSIARVVQFIHARVPAGVLLMC
jgi:hypothetical protein